MKDGPRFLGNGERFLWTSERSGFRHLYAYGTDGSLQRQLTSGNWEVRDVAGIDDNRGLIYFTSTEVSPLQTQLYSIRLDGSDKQRVSRNDGTHAISLAPGAGHFTSVLPG